MNKNIVSNGNIQQYLSQVSVKWLFNLVKEPWWGGVFERMVRSTKWCLKKSLNKLNSFMMHYTLLLLKLRQLSILDPYISYITPDDLEEPLTSSHLLMGMRVLSLLDNFGYQGEIEDGAREFQMNPTDLTRRVNHLNSTLNQPWGHRRCI